MATASNKPEDKRDVPVADMFIQRLSIEMAKKPPKMAGCVIFLAEQMKC